MSLALATYCDLLFGAEPEGAYIEIRAIGGNRTNQEFIPVCEVGFLGSAVRSHTPLADVYVGAAPRTRREGTRDAVRRSHVLWADLDSPESILALDNFAPEPSMVLDTGRGRHAYWSISPPAASDDLERANRRLAHQLGGDMASTDAARVLRPPGSVNRKRGGKVTTIVETAVEVYEVDYVVGDLDDPPTPARPRGAAPQRVNGGDPLLEISPIVYVEELLGVTVGRDGKVHCPFPGHRNGDRTPSLHVFEDPVDGWFCFGCRRGGSIFDLAAELADVRPRGDAFLGLADYLRKRFL